MISFGSAPLIMMTFFICVTSLIQIAYNGAAYDEALGLEEVLAISFP